jgi:GT2 family glycosyltransferase
VVNSRLSEQVAAAADSWRRGIDLVQAGDLGGGRRWLERAIRLAPNDPRIALDLANVCLNLGIADPPAFERLARRYDIATAWQGLIAAHLLAGDAPAAAAALGNYLQRHCLPEDFSTIAGNLAGSAGWCAVSAAGALLAQAPPGGAIRARLDGRAIRLPERLPPDGAVLRLRVGGRDLLGSPLDLHGLRRVEGVVAAAPDGIAGWAARPAAPWQPPALTLRDAAGAAIPVMFNGAILPADDDAPLLPRHEFRVPHAELRGLSPPFRLDCDGAALFGSPLDPAALTALPRTPAARRGKAPPHIPRRRGLAVVMPVYRDFGKTRACLLALFAAVPPRTRIIVIDDATPEPAIARWLDRLAAAGRITLIRHARNLGFPASVNAGIRTAGGRDVLLLNSDTLVPAGAIATMVAVAYGQAAAGTVTPFSNEATICSYPDPAGGNPPPPLGLTSRLNALAQRANGEAAVEIPTAIGFCMLIRHDCLAATGRFRDGVFAQGYGEENDFCLRARHLGFRHFAATGAYVAHHGGVSFGAAGRALNRRNAGILNLLHPGYEALIRRWIAADRLAAARRRFDMARFAARRRAAAVLLISHNHGGGVARRVAEDMAAITAAGRRPILLFPAAPEDPQATPFPWDSQLTDGATGDYPRLRFRLPEAMDELLELLRAESVRQVILHHGLGQDASVRGIAAVLGVAQHIVVHDYASFCPRVNLLTRPKAAAPLRYCGEPNVAGCIACVKIAGDETFEGLGVTALLARSAAEFAAAARVIAPSDDAARRVARHFPGVVPEVSPWEDDGIRYRLRPPPRGRRRIVTIGGIGPQKGLEILIACAADAAARGLPLEFAVAGASAEDERLMAAGIFVTGAYEEGEALGLIRGLEGDLAFLPSIWPETWCFTLTEAWRAGLYAIAFDLGAPADRIRATRRGGLLPLGLPPARINEALLAWQADSGN